MPLSHPTPGGPTSQAEENVTDLRDPAELRSQYESQRALLTAFDLLASHDGAPGIWGIDGRFHPLPSFEIVQPLIAAPWCQQKVEQGFARLLLVPFGLPLARLTEAWREGLLRHADLLREHGGLDRGMPLWVWNGYEREALAYFPERFEQDHGGRTKWEILSSDSWAAWQVLLIEESSPEVPPLGEGRVVGGRRQLERGGTPRQYLEALPEGEIGWTPEVHIMAFLDALERKGTVLDLETITFLIGSYCSAAGQVPDAYWNWRQRQACLDARTPDIGHPYDGARTAVRILL